MTINADELERARMSLTMAVNQSSNAVRRSEKRVVDEHRMAAETRLKQAGREDLALRIMHDLDEGDAETRRNLREIMQLIDVELEDRVDSRRGFETAEPVADGGDRL